MLYYELLGDLLIAWVLLKLRPRLPEGATLYLYLTLFAVMRFALFFVRGNVPVVALGLKNAVDRARDFWNRDPGAD